MYEDNIFNNERIGGAGGKIGDAILARIDNTNNMVCADPAVNQAKSNVVTNNRNDPNHPPQEQLINSISDFQNSAIYNAEFFVRNIAAANAGRFHSVAQDVMNLLSEITPTSPPHDSKSIPLLLYEWLENTLSADPQGGVNHANAVIRAYQARMNRVSVLTQVFPVPHDSVSLSFTRELRRPASTIWRVPTAGVGLTRYSSYSQKLMPRRPPMSECNPPGTLGKIGVFDDQGHKIIDTNQTTARTMGSGSAFTVGLGSGANLDDWHYNAWVGANPTAFPRCKCENTTRPPVRRMHTLSTSHSAVNITRAGIRSGSKPTGHLEYFLRAEEGGRV
ncbi:hypothetical protein EXIGLDRAFT_784149 [Exidia glandulosa HHB12029]|uniref:Uncharacterized protein n=1 Tax=Exidia glandulosa HHB12029 TaxID=1314781 RepID=A0A165Z028_EXIGL|nr:hypothetical protein EXIGLDRAFT_784149 [Exidia glandulosa HHB12029]